MSGAFELTAIRMPHFDGAQLQNGLPRPINSENEQSTDNQPKDQRRMLRTHP